MTSPVDKTPASGAASPARTAELPDLDFRAPDTARMGNEATTVYKCSECDWVGHTPSNCPKCAAEVTTAEGTGASNGADAQRLDWLEKHCTGASDSERYLPFRIYWGKTTMGGFKGIRAAIDAALAGEGRK